MARIWTPVLLLLSAAVVPVGAATHWCPFVALATQPASAYAGDVVPFSVTLMNSHNASVEVFLNVRFGWEPQFVYWGTADLMTSETQTNTFSKVVTNNPGDFGVTLAAQGRSPAGTSAESIGSCPPVSRNFRVDPMPPSPTVVIVADHTAGAAPLQVVFRVQSHGGLSALQLNWSFGDGATAAGPQANHTYKTPGDYTAQVVATDSRGRLGVDRVRIQAFAPSERAGNDDDTGPMIQLTGRGAVLAAGIGTTALLLSLALSGTALLRSRPGRRLAIEALPTLPRTGVPPLEPFAQAVSFAPPNPSTAARVEATVPRPEPETRMPELESASDFADFLRRVEEP